MTGYNYTKFNADNYDLVGFTGPKIGGKAPDVELTALDGTIRNLLDFDAEFLVLEFGSNTCPLFQSRRLGMARITDDFPNVDSIVIYVREAHPGRNIPAHTAIKDKTEQACKLRDEDGEGREILIDNMQGSAHRAYGSYPNAVFIINHNGCVVYRSAWNNPAATTRALHRLMAGKTAPGEGFFLPGRPTVSIRTLRLAGPGAGWDFLRSLPSLIAKNLIRRNLRLLFCKGPRDVAADTHC